MSDAKEEKQLFELLKSGDREAFNALQEARITQDGSDSSLEDARPIGLHFVDKELTNFDFRGFDLSDVSFKSCDLSGGNFEGMDLRSTHLYLCLLVGANLNDTNLSYYGKDDDPWTSPFKLLGANLTGASLIGANLHGQVLISYSGEDVNLRGANLTNAKLSKCKLKRIPVEVWASIIGLETVYGLPHGIYADAAAYRREMRE